MQHVSRRLSRARQGCRQHYRVPERALRRGICSVLLPSARQQHNLTPASFAVWSKCATAVSRSSARAFFSIPGSLSLAYGPGNTSDEPECCHEHSRPLDFILLPRKPAAASTRFSTASANEKASLHSLWLGRCASTTRRSPTCKARNFVRGVCHNLSLSAPPRMLPLHDLISSPGARTWTCGSAKACS